MPLQNKQSITIDLLSEATLVPSIATTRQWRLCRVRRTLGWQFFPFPWLNARAATVARPHAVSHAGSHARSHDVCHRDKNEVSLLSGLYQSERTVHVSERQNRVLEVDYDAQGHSKTDFWMDR